MKRTLLTILAIFYLGISTGASMHFHYCMNELVSWGLEKQSSKECEFCGMSKADSKKNSCCKDVEKQGKVDSTQKVSPLIYKFNQLAIALIQPPLYHNYQAEIPLKIVREALSNAPPDEQPIPVYIKNCTYRI